MGPEKEESSYQPCITVTDTCLVPMSHDVCGQLRTASLTVHGSLLQIVGLIGSGGTYLSSRYGDDRFVTVHAGGEWEVYPDSDTIIGLLEDLVSNYFFILPVLPESVRLWGLLLEQDKRNDQYWESWHGFV